VNYFIAVCDFLGREISHDQEKHLRAFVEKFDLLIAEKVKDKEAETNHDVKAVQYVLQDFMREVGFSDDKIALVHFCLTSSDVDSVARTMMFRDAVYRVIADQLCNLIKKLHLVSEYWDVPMMSRTHGQPASPTTMKKEVEVYISRLGIINKQIEEYKYTTKLAGATGNLNAHYAAYLNKDWKKFHEDFLERYGFKLEWPTTQISHHDNMAGMFNLLAQVNTILLDLSKDVWMYISFGYLKQSVVESEVGSSAMPHKVNPIDFENAEGNAGMAIPLLQHFANILPISRMQRDLSGSTVLRNAGVPLAWMLIAMRSLEKGLGKIELNQDHITADLENHWEVVTEAYQAILSREGDPNAYNTLKEFTRGKSITKELLHRWIDGEVNDSKVRDELKKITPFNYIGILAQVASSA